MFYAELLGEGLVISKRCHLVFCSTPVLSLKRFFNFSAFIKNNFNSKVDLFMKEKWNRWLVRVVCSTLIGLVCTHRKPRLQRMNKFCSLQ